MKLRPPFPVDLVLRTPRELRRRVEMGDPFILDILEEGKVLYEAPHRCKEAVPCCTPCVNE